MTHFWTHYQTPTRERNMMNIEQHKEEMDAIYDAEDLDAEYRAAYFAYNLRLKEIEDEE